MTEDMIPNILHFAEQTASTKLPITFNMFGGEPLANWKFFKSFVEITNSHFKHEHKFITTINGTLLNSKIIDFLAKNKVEIAVSLDGIEESNKARITIDGKPTWNSIMQILPEIKAKIPKTILLMVIGKHNYKYLYENCKFFNKLEFNYNVNWNMEDDYTKEELEEIEKQLKRVKEEGLVQPNNVIKNNNKEDGTVCLPADKAITIAPNGKLYFCHQFVPKMIDTEDLSYGNIKDGITNEELYNNFVDRTYFFSWSKDKKIICNSCDIKEDCRGGCIADQWHKDKDFLKIRKSVCDFSRINFNIKEDCK